MVPVGRNARYWLTYFAGGGLVLAALLIKPLKPKRNQSEGDAEHGEDAALEAIAAALHRAEKRYLRKHEHYESPPTLANKLKAAIGRMTTSEWLMVVFTGVIAAVGVVSAVIAHGQQVVMQGQLDEMRDEQRAWVYADIPVFLKPITQNVNGVWEMRIQFILKNTGHLPALNVTPVVESPVPTINLGEIIADYQHKNCIDKGPDYSAITGDTLFPGQEIKRAITIGMWPADMAFALTNLTILTLG